MSAPRDPDVVLAAWLDDGPADLPSSTRRAISTAVRTTPQARMGLGLPAWRPTTCPDSSLLAGAAAVVAVAVGAFAIAMPRPSGVISVPAATPAPSTPSPSPFISTVDWLPFSSTRYGYESAYPPNWTARQSVRAWSIDDKDAWDSPAADQLDGGDVLVTAFAADLPPGTSADEWISSYLDAGARR